MQCEKSGICHFTVLNFQGKQVSLYQFDNPDAILIRDGKLFDYPVETSMIEEKEIHKSCFELKDEDMLIIMSDGVTNAGMGKLPTAAGEEMM